MADTHNPQAVLDFWFGAEGLRADAEPRSVWFRKDPGFDALVRERFGAVLVAAMRGELAQWGASPEGLLALIVVLDQFSRNIHRGTPASFSADAAALGHARRMLELGWDLRLPPIARWFAYLPFEHSEALADQEKCLELMTRLAAEPHLGELPEWAARHLAVILRFGRFPHRNAILGRVSTPEEMAFLDEPGASF